LTRLRGIRHRSTFFSNNQFFLYPVEKYFVITFTVAMGRDSVCGTVLLTDLLSIPRWYMSEYGAAMGFIDRGKPK
jgi:hypothetical protein